MPRIDNVKRILVDQYPKEDRQTVSQLAETINYFMEQVTNTLNGNVDFDNLKTKIVQLELTVDSNGIPLSNGKFSASTGIIGTKVIRVDNLTNTGVYPTTAPFINYTASGSGIYTITNITGLLPGYKWRLIFEVVKS